MNEQLDIRCYTVKSAAQELDVTEGVIKDLIQEGTLPTYSVNGTCLISRIDLARYLNGHETEAQRQVKA